MLLSSRAWAAGAFFSLGASTYSTYQPHTAEERPHHLSNKAPTGKKKKSSNRKGAASTSSPTVDSKRAAARRGSAHFRSTRT